MASPTPTAVTAIRQIRTRGVPIGKPRSPATWNSLTRCRPWLVSEFSPPSDSEATPTSPPPTHFDVAKFLSTNFFPGASDDTQFVIHNASPATLLQSKRIARKIHSGDGSINLSSIPRTLSGAEIPVRNGSDSAYRGEKVFDPEAGQYLDDMGKSWDTSSNSPPITFSASSSPPSSFSASREHVVGRYRLTHVASEEDAGQYRFDPAGPGPGLPVGVRQRLAEKKMRQAEAATRSLVREKRSGVVEHSLGINYLSVSQEHATRRVIFAAEATERVYELTHSADPNNPPVLFLVRKKGFNPLKVRHDTTVLCSEKQFGRKMGLGYNTYLARSLGLETKLGEHRAVEATVGDVERLGLERNVGFVGKLKIWNKVGPAESNGGQVRTLRRGIQREKEEVVEEEKEQKEEKGEKKEKAGLTKLLFGMFDSKPTETETKAEGTTEEQLETPSIIRKHVVLPALPKPRTASFREINLRLLKNFFPQPAEIAFLSQSATRRSPIMLNSGLDNLSLSRDDLEPFGNEQLAIYSSTVNYWKSRDYRTFRANPNAMISAIAMLRSLDTAVVKHAVDVACRLRLTHGNSGVLVIGEHVTESQAEVLNGMGIDVVALGKNAVESWGLRFLAECVRVRFPNVEVEVVYEDGRVSRERVMNVGDSRDQRRPVVLARGVETV